MEEVGITALHILASFVIRLTGELSAVSRYLLKAKQNSISLRTIYVNINRVQ